MVSKRKRASSIEETRVVRAHKAGIPASKLGSELGIKPINIYLWTREVRKKGRGKGFPEGWWWAYPEAGEAVEGGENGEIKDPLAEEIFGPAQQKCYKQRG